MADSLNCRPGSSGPAQPFPGQSLPDSGRLVITGWSLLTSLGHRPDDVLAALLSGASALTGWKRLDPATIGGAWGSDLSALDDGAWWQRLKEGLPAAESRRLSRLLRPQPLTVRTAILMALEAWRHAGLGQIPSTLAGTGARAGAGAPDSPQPGNPGIPENTRQGAVVAGSFLLSQYVFDNTVQYGKDRDYIDGLFGLHGLDSNVGSSVAEALSLHGPLYSASAACASGNYALRLAAGEILSDAADVMLVVAPVLQSSPVDLFSLSVMGALDCTPGRSAATASRPFDRQRNGFVPAEGGAVLVVERLSHARARGATILAELCSVAVSSDGSHQPSPQRSGQRRAMQEALRLAGMAATDVDVVSLHATGTPAGDLSELEALRDVFAGHEQNLLLSVPKSLTGHCLWAAATVETVLALMQMQQGRWHRTANLDQPEDTCAGLDWGSDGQVRQRAGQDKPLVVLKNSFGFGGYNSAALFRQWRDDNTGEENQGQTGQEQTAQGRSTEGQGTGERA